MFSLLLSEVPVAPVSVVPSVPAVVEPIEAVEKPIQPVQTLEERGDAMLFEIDALQGMPFDEAIITPFN